MTPIEHNRWRSRAKGYVVTVTNVTHQHGPSGTVTFVTFKTRTRSLSWSAVSFLRAFEPIGRKLRRRSIWERLLRGRDSV